MKAVSKGTKVASCLRCPRVEVIQHGSQTLPANLRGADFKLDDGICMIVCGACRPEDVGSHRTKDDLRSGFGKLKIEPAVFAGLEVAHIARAIMSFEVAFITANGRVAFKDIYEIVKGLTAKDRLMSVDLGRFKKAERKKLLLPYLAGGLTT